MDDVCRNPFAVSLLFYDRYGRVKLQDTAFYGKILDIYRNRPSDILKGLRDKYATHYSIPESVSLRSLQRLFCVYNVPDDYRAVILRDLPLLGQNQTLDSYFGDEYNETYDVYSENFNAEKAFANHPPYLTRPENEKILIYDNLAKAKHLVHKDVREFVVPDRSLVDSLRAEQKIRETRQRLSKPHIFEEIIRKILKENSQVENCAKRIPTSPALKEGLEKKPNPYHVVQNLITSRIRASIVVRRKSGIKAIMTCYIKAVDRHMNMLLVDVDDVSAAPGKKAKISVLRKAARFTEDVSNMKLTRSYFDQVLLRGDCVVLVSKA